MELNLIVRHTTVVGKHPETIWFLVGFEPATHSMAPIRLACVGVQCLNRSPMRTATKIVEPGAVHTTIYKHPGSL